MKPITVAGLVALSGLWTGMANGALVINSQQTPFLQNFDTLVSSGTGSSLPDGWAFAESGTSANSIYTAGTGSSITGDTYSFGASGSTDRALGELTSGSLQSIFGVEVQNGSGSTIRALQIAYVGEQWRLASATSDRLDFQYSLDASGLTSGQWVDVNLLDFVAPVTTGETGSLDGNAPGNRVSLQQTISGLSFDNNGTIWFRWVGVDAGASDYGLAIDDFSITAVPEPRDWGLICAAALLGLGGLHSWRERRRALRP